MTDKIIKNPHAKGPDRPLGDQLEEANVRLRRMETRLTASMRYQGFHTGRDCDVLRKSKVATAEDKNGCLELHATGPEVPLAWLFQAMLDADVLSANLYVNGLHRGRIQLDARGEDE